MPLDLDERAAFERSVEAHRLAAGQGCAELLNADLSSCALLLEQLGPNLDELHYEVPRILETIATTLQTFWRPIHASNILPTGADKAQWLASYVTNTWSDLGKPCSQRVVDQAVRYCDSRADAFDPATAVLVHGDAHGWNTLAAGPDAFKFVDVEGLISEPAHDLSVAMREYNEPLLGGDTARLTTERAETLASLCAVDAQAVWEWGFVERVSTGLANLRDFGSEEGTPFLDVAERCA